ncbi:MAG TPA: Rieske 2Fe-2S domain-containing protein [Caulifigura sp.]|jgi:nitrite reductase/ring-hydroxylating ferredoxin subunit|nr:Rieske 2Fe-2S domain-containing protein [Caulifigura sp.]
MSERIPLCQVSEVPVGSGRECVADDRIIAVFNVDGRFYALDGICPHAGGPLANGCVTGTVVTCPWHGWQFDVATGKHQLTPRIQQTRFEVVVDQGTLYLVRNASS